MIFLSNPSFPCPSLPPSLSSFFCDSGPHFLASRALLLVHVKQSRRCYLPSVNMSTSSEVSSCPTQLNNLLCYLSCFYINFSSAWSLEFVTPFSKPLVAPAYPPLAPCSHCLGLGNDEEIPPGGSGMLRQGRTEFQKYHSLTLRMHEEAEKTILERGSRWSEVIGHLPSGGEFHLGVGVMERQGTEYRILFQEFKGKRSRVRGSRLKICKPEGILLFLILGKAEGLVNIQIKKK